jgi:pimeloyl-ACP methyl ester carboxylesterase
MGVDTALVHDVVVVVPGIMGSELVARDGRPLWTVSPGGLTDAIRALRSGELVLPRDHGDGAAPDGVRPAGLLRSLHVIPGLWSPVTGYEGLLNFLRGPNFQLIEAERGEPEVIPNLISFAYDWRLSNRYNGQRLRDVALRALERWRDQPDMGEAKLVLLCHSMGGLVARWFAEREGGAEFIRAIVTIGTPHRGALKALTALVNGLEPRFGPLHLSLGALARSLPSLYQLLPQYDCIVAGAGPRIGIGAASGFDLDKAMWSDACAFHTAINENKTQPYALHKVVGIRQPTATTARVVDGRIESLFEIEPGVRQGGDGTVPRLAAQPLAGHDREVHELAGQHGELQAVPALLDLVDGILTRERLVWQSSGAEQGFGVVMDEVWSQGDAPVLEVVEAGDRRLMVTLHDEAGQALDAPLPLQRDGRFDFGRLREGGYRAHVAPVAPVAPGGPPPVTKPFVVLAP